jgi:hypothetical protein
MAARFLLFAILIPLAAGAQAQNALPPPAPIAETVSVQPQAATKPQSRQLDVSGSELWTDTGIDVTAGDSVIIDSEGTMNYASRQTGPQGLARGWRSVLTALPVNEAGVGAVIGRIGDSVSALPFLVGLHKEMVVTQPGRLYLGINRGANETGTGAFRVKLQVSPGTKTVVAVKPLNFPAERLDKFPRRVSDKDGNWGDMVNFVILGPQDKMKAVFAGAGWVLVDKTKTEAALHVLLNTYNKQAYTEMPMSELYLFSRSQDFGYAHAEPVQVVHSRHHLRLWKAPFQIDSQDVWIGAATHDIGFAKDNRKPNAVTHKIDPDIDLEREYVAQTLKDTGLIPGMTYVMPSNPVREAITATGGSFHSDGRVLILVLQ